MSAVTVIPMIQPRIVEGGPTLPPGWAFSSGINNAFSAWTQIIASLANRAVWFTHNGSLRNDLASGVNCTLQLGVGSAGNEVAFETLLINLGAAAADGSLFNYSYSFPALINIAAGSRLAVRARSGGSTATNVVGTLNVLEA